MLSVVRFSVAVLVVCCSVQFVCMKLSCILMHFVYGKTKFRHLYTDIYYIKSWLSFCFPRWWLMLVVMWLMMVVVIVNTVTYNSVHISNHKCTKIVTYYGLLGSQISS